MHNETEKYSKAFSTKRQNKKSDQFKEFVCNEFLQRRSIDYLIKIIEI